MRLVPPTMDVAALMRSMALFGRMISTWEIGFNSANPVPRETTAPILRCGSP